jgi:lysophospholipase L1-like esterase
MTFTFLKKIHFVVFIILVITLNIYAQTETGLTLLSPNGGEYWTTGSFPRITWKSSNVLVIKIEISYDAGLTWEVISPAAVAVSGSYSKWQIGSQVQSNECRIRISKYDDPALYDISESYFTITSNTISHTLVVLGSSTAVGVGTSTSDSAWVSRYRNYLFEKNTTIKVINLAVGGYTTYDIMPTGFIPPANRPAPKPGNNISKAVEYNPEAIIINLPSNDVNLGFTISEQLSNYDTVLAFAKLHNIPVWVSTTQPRNFSTAQIQKQIEMRDSTFARFGDKAIDFWTDIADSVGRINSEFNSGDGIHLNDKGHAILFSRVRDAKIFDPMILEVEEFKYAVASFNLAQNYPNPFNPSTRIIYSIPSAGTSIGTSTVGTSLMKFLQFVQLKVYDVLGNEIATLVDEYKPAGNYEVIFDASSVSKRISSGVYFYRLRINDLSLAKKMILMR